MKSERSFLRDAQRFFWHLFPGSCGASSLLVTPAREEAQRFLEPLRREIVREPVGDPETFMVDSTLLPVLHPRHVKQSAGFAGADWARWGSFSVYGVNLHLICATKGVPLSDELTPANVAEVQLSEELLADAVLLLITTRPTLFL